MRLIEGAQKAVYGNTGSMPGKDAGRYPLRWPLAGGGRNPGTLAGYRVLVGRGERKRIFQDTLPGRQAL